MPVTTDVLPVLVLVPDRVSMLVPRVGLFPTFMRPSAPCVVLARLAE